MAPDSPPTTAPPSAGAPEAIRDKLRIRFRKGGDLRLLSHHDLMRCFERMLRRAALPFRSTQGYHPKPRLIFALSLPLGVVGCEEVVELELEEVLSLEEVRDRLVRQAPAGLEVLGLRRVGPRDGAQVRSLCYRVAVPPERVAALRERAAAVLAAADCWVERTRPEPRRVDLRPFLRDLRVVEGGGWRVEGAKAADEAAGNPPPSTLHPPPVLEVDLWLTPGGTARPEEALTVLGLHDLLDAGAVIERARLELVDETPPPLAQGIA